MARGKPVGNLDLSVLGKQWAALDTFEQVIERTERQFETSRLLTARKIDEGQVAGHRPYIAARAHLDGGMEHVHALQDLFEHVGASPRAPWTLLRSVFEAGFWATWILEPHDGELRRQRGLRVEARGLAERDNYYRALLINEPEALAVLEPEHAEQTRKLRDEASRLGLSWSKAKDRINVVFELERLETLRTDPELRGPILGIWRSLSGMQHGYAYALMANSDMTDETPILGGARGTVSINDDAFIMAASGAHRLLLAGMTLLIERMTRL